MSRTSLVPPPGARPIPHKAGGPPPAPSQVLLSDSDLPHDLEERRVDAGRPPGQIGEGAAPLGDEECAGSRVPRRQAELEEAVEDAGCDVGEVQRGATGAADRTRFHEERPEDREIPIDQVLLAERKARRESRALEVLARRHAQPLPVAERSRARLGGEEILLDGVPHDASLESAEEAAPGARDRDGPMREAAHEVRRAVERVDDPRRSRLVDARKPRLFAEKAVAGKRAEENAPDDGLALAIRDRDDVILRLLLDARGIQPPEVREKNLSGLARGGDRGIDRAHAAQWNTGGSSSSAIFSDAARACTDSGKRSTISAHTARASPRTPSSSASSARDRRFSGSSGRSAERNVTARKWPASSPVRPRQPDRLRRTRSRSAGISICRRYSARQGTRPPARDFTLRRQSSTVSGTPPAKGSASVPGGGPMRTMK